MAFFCPLFSGSSGNCYYIGGCEGNGVLIDAGVSAKRIRAALRRMAIDPGSIKAIFVTHEHSDHIYGLRVLAAQLSCNVYASSGTLQELGVRGLLTIRLKAEAIDGKGIEAGGMFIKPFTTPHDSSDSIGYIITTDDQKKIGFATDLGSMTDEVRSSLRGCDLVVLESNHDIQMLEAGRYPIYLKRRILSETGHLSNACCAGELPELVRAGATIIVLAHLSRENNVPQLAYETSLRVLSAAGMKERSDFKISVAPVCDPRSVTIF
jgi:phosphoribosyl 1,2-cyclic phosphodiesterase